MISKSVREEMRRNTMEIIDEIKSLILESRNTVFLGGAGVSTESGIPDFRGPNGLRKKRKEVIRRNICLATPA